MNRLRLLACSGLLIGACAPQYKYQPTTHATAELGGHLAAEYQIPKNAPQGDLRLASFGISKVSPKGDAKASMRAIHVRMEVANNSNQPWKLDTREQLIDFSDGTKSHPALVRTNQGQSGLPEVTVAAGSKRVIDLFYTLPAQEQSSKKIPNFDAISKVDIGKQTVTERTPFDRLRVEPTYASSYGYGYDGYGAPWGGPFWYDQGAFPYDYMGADMIVGAPSWTEEEGEE